MRPRVKKKLTAIERSAATRRFPFPFRANYRWVRVERLNLGRVVAGVSNGVRACALTLAQTEVLFGMLPELVP